MSYSALAAAHFVFELERALFFVPARGDIGGPLVVALLCRINTSVPKFERPWFSMRAGEDGIGGPTGWLHFVLHSADRRQAQGPWSGRSGKRAQGP